MEDGDFGVVSYPLFKIWPLEQRVGGISLSGSMLDGKMVFGKQLMPSGLSAGQVLRMCEVGEIFVVSENLEWVFDVKYVDSGAIL